MDGGIVSEILVKEGQIVRTGDLLLKVDPTRMVSSLRENRSQYLSLLAKGARLRALADGARFLPPPEVVKEASDIVEQERALYESRRAELDATIGVARQQLSQRTQELVSTYKIIVELKNGRTQVVLIDSGTRDRKSTRLNSSHRNTSRMPSSA